MGVPGESSPTTTSRRTALVLLLASALLGMSGSVGSQEGSNPVLTLRLAEVIGPASADFIVRGIKMAAEKNSHLVIIELDTPGGLDTSMRQIIKAILASPVPVATFVAPEGARAASAGTFILYASHIAAMAPATNLGAASPVSIGGAGGSPDPGPAPPGDQPAGEPGAAPPPGDTLSRKVMNDAAAYIRSLAELRGRNADWAERAVREGVSLPAKEALAENVIGYVADDVPDLLRQLDGSTVKVQSGEVTLATAAAGIEVIEPDWRNRLLSVIANPQVAVILMMIGVYGLFIEFTSPGFGVPGVAGAIFLLLALFAFQLLPVNWAGMALLGVGLILMVAELLLPSFGVLGIGGIVAMLLGGLFLFETDVPGYGLSLPLVVGMALSSAVLILGVGSLALRSRRTPVVSGREEMIGSTGTLLAADDDGAWVRVHGESWRVKNRGDFKPGDLVRVKGLDGLQLEVERVASPPVDEPGR